MGFFAKHLPPAEAGSGTTLHFFLGKPEADSEDDSAGGISFKDFFEDFADISANIENGRFLILGRKGAGKSAYVKWVSDLQKEDPTLFAEKIKGEDLKFYQLLKQLPSETDERHSLLFEWIIQTKLIELIIKSRRAQFSSGVTALKKFLSDNSDIASLDGLMSIDVTVTKGPSLNVGSLSGIFNLNLGKKSERKLKRPDFWNFIPTLRGIIREVLNYPDLAGFYFFLMFDELDYKLKLKEKSAKVQLMDLVRTVRNYNVDYLKDTNAKILIFMRDDVGRSLDGIAHDKSKIFESHAYLVNWYSPIDETTDEREHNLRKFINKRLKANFEHFKYPYNKEDPWLSFVDETEKDVYQSRTAFKHILDHTFYRPRDLINLFLNIGNHALRLPLSSKEIRQLLRDFAKRNFSEIADELSIIYDDQQMNQFRFAMNMLAKERTPITYKKVSDALLASHLGLSELETLVSYSVIAPFDSKNRIFYFNFRETHPTDSLKNLSFILPYGIQLYFNPRAKTSLSFDYDDA